MQTQQTLSRLLKEGVLDQKLLKSGPLRKQMSSYILDDVAREISKPDATYSFELDDDDGLILIFKNNKKSKKHYLSLLLKSANLNHLFLEKEFCDFYLKTVESSSSLLKLKSLEILKQEKIIKEDDNVTLAHQYAVYTYTSKGLVYELNRPLRNNLDHLTLAKKKHGEESSYFQQLCCYTIGTVFMVADFLSKTPGEKNPLTDSISTDTAYRIQIHKKERAKNIDIIKGIEEAKAKGTDSFLVKEPAFMSTSVNKIGFATTPKVVKSNTTDTYIVIRFSDEYKKEISSLSEYSDEKEILLPPSHIVYTLLLEDGPFKILAANTVRPLNTQTRDYYMIQHGLRHIHPIVIQEYKDSKPDDEDHQLKLSGHPVIHRPNHGLAHAARQVNIIQDILEYFLQYATPKAKKACAFIQSTEAAFNMVQLAAMFLSVGRENEKSGEEDWEGYKKARRSARDQFEDYIKTYYDFCLRNQDVEKLFEYCLGGIQNLASLAYLNEIENQHVEGSKNHMLHLVSFHLLAAAHLLETPRCLKLEQGKAILEKRLFAENGSIVDRNSFSEKALEGLWEKSISRMEKMGDRILSEKGYRSQFYLSSTNPRYCQTELKLESSESPIIPLSPSQSPAKQLKNERYDTAFNLLVFLYKEGHSSDEQLESFFTPLMTNLFDSAFHHLTTIDQTKLNKKSQNCVIAIKEKAIQKFPETFSMPFLEKKNCLNEDVFFLKYPINIEKKDEKISYSFVGLEKDDPTNCFSLDELEPIHQKELDNAYLATSCSKQLQQKLFHIIILEQYKKLAMALSNKEHRIHVQWAYLCDPNLFPFLKYVEALRVFKKEDASLREKIHSTFYLSLIDLYQKKVSPSTDMMSIDSDLLGCHGKRKLDEQTLSPIKAQKHSLWKQEEDPSALKDKEPVPVFTIKV